MSILGELQLPNGQAFVELFEIDATAQGGDIIRFHAGTNGLRQPVVWQGNTYDPHPIMASGFEVSGQQLPRPKLAVANVNGLISALLMQSDLLGAKVTRKRTMVKYLDAVNFPARKNLLTYTEDMRNVAGGWGGGIARTLTSIYSDYGERYTRAQKAVSSSSDSFSYQFKFTAYTGQLTLTMKFRADTSDKLSFGFYNGAGWGANADSTATIISGPGTLVRSTGALWYVRNLSATEDTYVSITRNFLGDGSGAWIFAYPDEQSSTTIGKGVLCTAAQVEEGAAFTGYQPILGATFIRNPTADPNSYLPDEIWYISQKTSENAQIVEFELGVPIDLEGVMIPGRPIQANLCWWRYRGDGCGYAGPPVADANDNPTSILANDRCSHLISGCKLRWGSNAELPIGCFPSSRLTGT